ncbi:MAG: TlpA family protein disulfide reductase [Nitrococcus sp.]|nr:TlpA family protein disulfide reductase [Nitrococcus sp.]
MAIAGSGPIPFESGSLQKILDARAGEPFVLVLWSLRCVPCREEMELLSKLRRQHPALDVVFVSTDGMERAEDVTAALEQHGLAEAKSWIFAGPVQRLRYEIDPSWYGVLPRSYFYDANHERVAVSGGLEKTQILAWLDYLDSGSARPESE